MPAAPAGAAGAPGQFPGPLADHLVPLGPGDGLVDQPPGHGLLAGQALGLGGEVVRAVAAHVPLVHHPGQPAGAGQHPEQGKFRQRHRGRAVVDEHDVLARQGQLVAPARGGPVQRGQVGLPRVRAGVLDTVAGFVSELAEVDFPRMGRRGEHPDVRPGAEDLFLAAGHHDRADLGVLEAQPLDRVVQLDVHAQVVGVELELVAGHQATLLVHVHGQGGDRAVAGQPPVPVAPGVRAEVHSGLAGHDHPSAGPQISSMFYVRKRIRQVFVAYFRRSLMG